MPFVCLLLSGDVSILIKAYTCGRGWGCFRRRSDGETYKVSGVFAAIYLVTSIARKVVNPVAKIAVF